MFEHLSTHKRIIHTAKRICTRKPSYVLTHSKDKTAIAECRIEPSGGRMYLCAACLSYVETEAFARRFAIKSIGAWMLRVLNDVLSVEAGYIPPLLRDNAKAALIWNNLKQLEKHKLVFRSHRPIALTSVFVARDACPDPECLRRHGKHSEKCSLSFGEAFAERIRKEVA
jgi:hypothetical protein